MYRYLVILTIVLWTAGNAGAANWADGMFDSLWRNFGSVPRGPVISHPFRIINNTGRQVHIRSIRVSDASVSAQALKTSLGPGEETAIVAKMNTGRFVNTHTGTITVTFDQPRWAEVRLWLRANSRADVNVNPGSLAFGQVKRGSTPTKTVRVSLYGNARFGIMKAWSDSNYVQPKYKLVKRSKHEVIYNLTTTLRDDTPPGRWYTDVWIQTNNPAMKEVRIPLTVDVESNLSINPSMQLLGQVPIGKMAVRKIFVRGVRPFRITRVLGTDRQLQVQNNEPKKQEVHILTLVLRPEAAGQIDRVLQIQTDLPSDNTIEFTVRAYAVPNE